ncbi:MAG: hypothetical protein AAFV07_20095 [Bacteroidota bacterium]
MNLHDFDEYVDPTILERGKAYYEDYAAVESVEWTGDGRVRAFVRGSDLYSVTIRLDSDENVLESYCNCPYDWGPVCKHEVAVMLYLRENEPSGALGGGGAVSLGELEEALTAYTANELRRIILDMARDMAQVRERIAREVDL